MPVALDHPELVVVAGAGVVRLRFFNLVQDREDETVAELRVAVVLRDARGELPGSRFPRPSASSCFPTAWGAEAASPCCWPRRPGSPDGHQVSARRPRCEPPRSIGRQVPELEPARRPRSRRIPCRLQARERRSRVPGVVGSSRPPGLKSAFQNLNVAQPSGLPAGDGQRPPAILKRSKQEEVTPIPVWLQTD